MQSAKKGSARRHFLFLSGLNSRGDYIDRAEFCTVFGIGFGVKRDLLTFGKGLEAVNLNCREMDKHIIAAVIVGNEAVALFSIEPLHCSGVHSGYLLQKFRTRKKYKV